MQFWNVREQQRKLRHWEAIQAERPAATAWLNAVAKNAHPIKRR